MKAQTFSFIVSSERLMVALLDGATGHLAFHYFCSILEAYNKKYNETGALRHPFRLHCLFIQLTQASFRLAERFLLLFHYFELKYPLGLLFLLAAFATASDLQHLLQISAGRD